MDTALWTPLEAEREQAIEWRLNQHVVDGARLQKELKTLDHLLEIGFIGELAPEFPGVVPARWHVIRRNPPPAPHSFMPIVGKDGEYVEPSFQIIEELKKRDLWKKESVVKMMDEYEAQWTRRKKQKDLEAEQRIDVGADLFRAANRLPGDGGMEKKLWGKGGKSRT